MSCILCWIVLSYLTMALAGQSKNLEESFPQGKYLGGAKARELSTASPTTCQSGHHLKRSFRRRRRMRVRCEPCELGRFQNQDQHSSTHCYPCPSGKWVNTEGSAHCQGGPVCAPGSFGKMASSDPTTSKLCTSCPIGKFQQVAGQGDCVSCPGGMYSDKQGSSTCLGDTPCPVGRFGPQFATSQEQALQCQVCPIGTFSEVTGRFNCLKCPEGKYNQHQESTSCQDIPNCGRYHGWDSRDFKCVVSHPWAEIISYVTWAIWTFSVFYLCFRAEPVYANEIMSMIAIFIMSIYLTVQSHISDVSMYVLVFFSSISSLTLMFHPFLAVCDSLLSLFESCRISPSGTEQVSTQTSSVVEMSSEKINV